MIDGVPTPSDAEHPGAAGVEDLVGWVAAARDRMLAPGGRGTLGFALVLWRSQR